jgi:hypothetical protein
MSSLKPGDLGWHLYPDPHPLKRSCKDCPFKRDAEGQGYLSPERLDGIRFAVSAGQPFWCHETVYSPKTQWVTDDDGEERLPAFQRHWRMCKGAADYVREHQAAGEGGS